MKEWRLIMSVDKTSPVPYYQQIADSLRVEIEEGVSQGNGFRMASEHELCERFGVTRTTVRSALDVLEREGRIYRQVGRGTFAAVRRLEQNITELVSTTEDMHRRGWSVSTRVLSLERVPATGKVSGALGLAPAQEVYELARLRVAGDEPISIQTCYLPAQLCPSLENHDLSASLYRLLEGEYNLQLWTARETLSARRATSAEAGLLAMTVRDAVLYAERVTYTANDTPVEYLEAVWRGDRYSFQINLSRPQ
jgi:GntR family transcriptional regulator